MKTTFCEYTWCPKDVRKIFETVVDRDLWDDREDFVHIALTAKNTLACALLYDDLYRRLTFLACDGKPSKYLAAFLRDKPYSTAFLVDVPYFVASNVVPRRQWIVRETENGTLLYRPPAAPRCPKPAEPPSRTALVPTIFAAIVPRCHTFDGSERLTSLKLSLFRTHMEFRFEPPIVRIAVPEQDGRSFACDDRQLLLRLPGFRNDPFDGACVRTNKMGMYSYPALRVHWQEGTFDCCIAMTLSRGSIIRYPWNVHARRYDREAVALYRALATVATVTDHAARVIQRAWRLAIASPDRALCRKRLQKEWDELR